MDIDPAPGASSILEILRSQLFGPSDGPDWAHDSRRDVEPTDRRLSYSADNDSTRSKRFNRSRENSGADSRMRRI